MLTVTRRFQPEINELLLKEIRSKVEKKAAGSIITDKGINYFVIISLTLLVIARPTGNLDDLAIRLGVLHLNAGQIFTIVEH